MTSTDTVTLSFPREARYYGVARLVVGGLAAPLQMSIDSLDDLWSAINTLVDDESLPVNGELTLRLAVGDDQMEASIGPFEAASLESALADGDGGGADVFSLRKLLGTFVDEFQVNGDGEWVTLTKRARAVA